MSTLSHPVTQARYIPGDGTIAAKGEALLESLYIQASHTFFALPSSSMEADFSIIREQIDGLVVVALVDVLQDRPLRS